MSAPATAARPSVLDRVLRDYQSVAEGLPGDAWAQAARARAAAQFTAPGCPAARDEQWRYANLRAFERLGGYRPASGTAEDAAAALKALRQDTGLPAPR